MSRDWFRYAISGSGLYVNEYLTTPFCLIVILILYLSANTTAEYVFYIYSRSIINRRVLVFIYVCIFRDTL